MKKRIFSLLLVIAMLVTVLPVNAFAADCDHSDLYWSATGDGRHSAFCYNCWETVYEDCSLGACQEYTSSQHRQQCSVCKGYTYSNHTSDGWTVTGSGYSRKHSGTCSDCGTTISAYCDNNGEYGKSDTQHWRTCSVCGSAGTKSNHGSYTTASNGDGTHSQTCGTCGYVKAPTSCSYAYDSWYCTSNESGHTLYCSTCGSYSAVQPHEMGYVYYSGDRHYYCCKICSYGASYSNTSACDYAYTNNGATHTATCKNCGNVKSNQSHSYNSQNKCVCGAEKHEHNWTVSASGNTITVTCTGATGTCEYNKNGGKLIVTASNAVYDGEAKSATVTNTIKTGSHYDDSYSVTYYEKQANGSYSSWGSSSAPINVGEYKAEVYSYLDNRKTASATFEISAKPVTVSATGYTGTYDGNAHGITVNGLEGTGLSVQYATSQNGYYSSYAPTYTDAGEYTVYYKVTGSNIDNYEITGQTGSAVVKINPVQVSVTATGYTGAYDGKAHGITVEVPEGMTVTYSEKENGYYNYYSSPEYTDAGTYTVYYKVTGDKNHTVTNGTGSATVTINKADLKTAVKATDYDGVYDGKAHGITVEAPDNVTISYSKDGEDWYGSYYANSYTDVGEYTVYYKVAVSEYLKKNFTNSEVTGSAKVKITQADLNDYVTVNAGDATFDYNGKTYTTEGYTSKNHSIMLDWEYKDANGRLPDYKNPTVEYSTDGGQTWSWENPAFEKVGSYTVQYRIFVEASSWTDEDGIDDNYNVISGSRTVTINVATLPIDGLAGYEGPFDGNWHYSFGYRVKGEYGFNYIYYTGAPWNSWHNQYGDNFTFTFTWTDENGVEKTTTFNTANDTWEKADNWPHYQKQNVSDYDEDAGHIVNVTIVDNNGNYKTWTGSYSVKIGPAVGPTCSDVEAVYDAKPHHLTLMFGIDMDAYDCIEYQVQDENGQWTGEWTQRKPDGNSSEPSPYEPAYTDVGEYPVKWRVKIDSDMDGLIGGYNASGEKEEGGAYNSLGSLEIIAPRYEYNTIKITPAPLTITANDNTITYGDEPADNGVTITGFKGSDNADTVLDQTGVSYTYNYKQYDDVGDYTITPAGIKLVEGNENYTITFADGKLTVEQKELGIVWGETVLPYTGEAQVPTATASGTVNGDEITLAVHGAQTDVGRYMATVTGITGEKADNYKLPANCEVDFEIVKTTVGAPVVTAKDETIRGKNDGGIVGLTTEMEYSADGGETWTKVTDPAVELAPGTYQVRYTETTTSDASAATEVTINPGKYLTVTLPEGEVYTTSTEEKADEQTYNDTFTFEVEIKDGYSKGENFKVTANGQELTPNEDGSYTITGIVEDVEVKVEGVVDNTAPTGTITVATNQWKKFVNNITFGIFFKNAQTVTITAEDNGSGIKSIEYIACEAVLTEEYVKAIVASEWKPYTAPFEIEPDAKVIVYAKITDKAGNVKFISSDGMVFDGTAPVFNGIQDGGEYNEETKFTVTDDNLDKVTVDGVEVKPDENGNYTLPMDNKEHVLVATDKSGNKTEITVTLRDIYNVTLPKGDGYETKGEPTVKDGDDYTFEVEIKDGYTKGDDFKVTVNGQEIKPNADGKYVVENVASDLEIVVSGVEKVKAPALTTETPKTGDDGLFLPLILFMLSGIACVSLIVFKKKFRF